MKNSDALDREVNRTIVLGSGSRMTKNSNRTRLAILVSSLLDANIITTPVKVIGFN